MAQDLLIKYAGLETTQSSLSKFKEIMMKFFTHRKTFVSQTFLALLVFAMGMVVALQRAEAQPCVTDTRDEPTNFEVALGTPNSYCFQQVTAANGVGVNARRRYTGITEGVSYQFWLNTTGTNVPTCVRGTWLNSSNGEISTFNFNFGAAAVGLNNPTQVQAPAGATKLLVSTNGTWSGTSALLNYRQAPPNSSASSTPVGTDNDFGNNTWNVYAYDAAAYNVTNYLNLSNGTVRYMGMYSNGTLNILSTDQWAQAGAPSSTTGYTGCTTFPTDLFAVVYKRRGFPCGNYSIRVRHDDGMRMLINGVQVYQNNGVVSSLSGIVWTGDLGENSTIEIRHAENTGNAYMDVQFTTNATYNYSATASASPNPICVGSTLNLTGGNSGTLPPGNLQLIFTPTLYGDEARWIIERQSDGVALQSGGPYYSTTAQTIDMSFGVPVRLRVRTDGTYNDNTCNWSLSCNGTSIGSGSVSAGQNVLVLSNISCGIVPTYSWTGPASFSSTAQNPTRASIQTTHAGVYTVVATAGQCAKSANTASVTVTPATVAPTFTAGPTTLCANSTSTYTATTTQGTVTYSIIGGSGAAINATTGALTSAGTADFTVRATSTNSPCGALTTDRAVTVTANPGAANNTTSNAGMCGNGSTRALTGTPAGGTFSLVSGPGSVSGTTYTATGSGNAVIRYTIAAVGSCPATTSDVTIAVTANPGAANNTTSNAGMCGNGSTRTLTGTPAGGTFSLVSGPGSVSGTTYTATGSGNAVIRYTIAAVGSCPATTSDVTIAVTANPGAANNTTSNAGMCGNGSTRTLTGTPAGGTFSLVSGPGSVSGTTYTATGSGNAVIRYTIAAVGSCPATTSDVTIAVTANPGAANNTTSNAGMCGNGSTRALTGTPAGGTFSLVSGPGSVSGTTYTATGSGNAVIRYTIAASGSCPATTSDVTIAVTADPGVANNTTSNAGMCGNGSTRALTGTPAGGTFSLVSGPGSVSGTTYTATGSGNAVIRYTIAAVGSCPATTSDVTIPVDAISAGGTASSNQTICTGSSPANLTVSGFTGSVTKWQYADDAAFTVGVTDIPSSASNTLTSAQMGSLTSTRFYRAVVVNGVCSEAYSNAVQITVNANRTVGAASSSPSVCVNTAMPNITHATTGVTGISSTTGLPAGVTASYASNTITISGTPTASGVFSYTITPSGCGSAVATGTITVYGLPTAGSHNTTTVEGCVGYNPPSIAAGTLPSGGDGNYTYQWQEQLNGGGYNNITGANGSSYDPPAYNTAGTYDVRRCVTDGCGNSACTSPKQYIISPDPSTPTATQSPSQTVWCNGTGVGQTITLSSPSFTGGNSSCFIEYDFDDGSGYTGAYSTSIPSFSAVVGTMRIRARVRCTGSGSSGCDQSAVVEYIWNIYPVFNAGAINSNAEHGCVGYNPNTIGQTASVAGSGSYTYQWQLQVDNGGWNNITGATSSLYDPPAINTVGVYEYRRVVTDAVCGQSGTSSGVKTVTVVNDPEAPTGTVSPAANVCVGDTVTITNITLNGGGLSPFCDSVYFRVDLTGTGSAYSAWSTTVPSIITSNAGSILIQMRRQCGGAITGCNFSPITTYSVNVSAPTVGGTLSGGNSPICHGGPTGTMSLSGQTGTIQKWQYDVNGDNNWQDIAHTNATYSGAAPAVGAVRYRVEVKSGACPVAYSSSVTINVAAQPQASLDDLDGQCSGLQLLAGQNPLPGQISGGAGSPSFLWEVEIPAGSGNWTTIGTNQNYTIAAPITNSNTLMDSNRVYRFTYSASAPGCNTAVATRNLTVYAPPTLNPFMDECVSTLDDGNFNKWDYIFMNASSIHGVAQVNDLTLGNNSRKVFNTVNNALTIYRIPMNIALQTFEVVDGKGCSVASTGFPTSTTLPSDLPRLNASGTDVSTCYMRSFNDWTHFKPGGNSGEVMVSLRDNGIDLGQVVVTSYKDSFAVPITTTGGSCAGFTQHAMRRHFKITSSNFPDGALISNDTLISVRLYFSDEDFQNLSDSSLANGTGQCAGNDDITVMNDLYVTKYTDTLTNTEDGDYMNNNPSGIYRVYYNGGPNGLTVVDSDSFNTIFGTTAKPYNYVQLEVSEFSEFWLHGGSSGSPLPVEMLFIEAKNINNSFIRILWATATEINNHKFEVERSEDGLTFIKIGEVMGNGTSTERHDYSFDDKTALPNIRYYYRLKQIDFDDKFEYSPIVSEMLKGEELFTVSEYIPNPASEQGKLFIKTGREQEISIEMHNYVGQVVKEGKTFLNKGSNTINVDFSDLAAGAYTTRIVAGNTVVVRRVIVNR